MGRMFDTSELNGLVRELAAVVPRRNVINQGRAVKQTAHEGMLITRASARTTARWHGRRYPPLIKSWRLGATAYEWGPTGPAANWSFEDGSRKQPPHRNHDIGANRIEGRLPLRAQAAAEDAFVGW